MLCAYMKYTLRKQKQYHATSDKVEKKGLDTFFSPIFYLIFIAPLFCLRCEFVWIIFFFLFSWIDFAIEMAEEYSFLYTGFFYFIPILEFTKSRSVCVRNTDYIYSLRYPKLKKQKPFFFLFKIFKIDTVFYKWNAL